MSHQKVTSKFPTDQQAGARDFARLGQHAVRVYGNGRCPFCLRRQLRASDVREIEAGLAPASAASCTATSRRIRHP